MAQQAKEAVVTQNKVINRMSAFLKALPSGNNKPSNENYQPSDKQASRVRQQ